MNRTSLGARYTGMLHSYVRTPSEELLAGASGIGRSALEQGLSLPDLSELHHACLATASPVGLLASERAAEFFAEALAPYEMGLRGYREANDGLLQRNAELRARNEELARAREAAEAACRELEAFSYAVSHDLRAPLRAIRGFSLALAEDLAGKLDAESQTHVDYILAGSQQMALLIDALLRLSKVSRTDLYERSVDLTETAHAVLAQLRAADPGRDVEVVIEADLRVEGDPQLLRALLENLIGNAWKFTSRRPSARIVFGREASEQGEAFFVRDNGAGFDMAHAANLFAPFQRLHRDGEYPGTGIGLATVQRIVARHGGRIWVDSAVDRGATFRFTLGGVTASPLGYARERARRTPSSA